MLKLQLNKNSKNCQNDSVTEETPDKPEKIGKFKKKKLFSTRCFIDNRG